MAKSYFLYELGVSTLIKIMTIIFCYSGRITLYEDVIKYIDIQSAIIPLERKS